MLQRTLVAGGALAAALFLSASAMAAPGVSTGDVRLRAGPGTRYAIITTIPRGAPVEVLGCTSWCHVIYAGREGYASANYIATGYASPAPRYRVAPPPVTFWYYGRPRWDDRYHHWRAGDWYWYDRRWHRRPRTGFSFEFRF